MGQLFISTGKQGNSHMMLAAECCRHALMQVKLSKVLQPNARQQQFLQQPETCTVCWKKRCLFGRPFRLSMDQAAMVSGMMHPWLQTKLEFRLQDKLNAAEPECKGMPMSELMPGATGGPNLGNSQMQSRNSHFAKPRLSKLPKSRPRRSGRGHSGDPSKQGRAL